MNTENLTEGVSLTVTEIDMSDITEVRDALLKTQVKSLLYQYEVKEEGVIKVVPSNYLALNYLVQDEDKAFEAIKTDLKILHDKGLILGHLAMPSTLELTPKDLLPRRLVFCFLFLDLHKVAKDLGLKFSDVSCATAESLNDYLGTKHAVLEGGIGLDISEPLSLQEALFSGLYPEIKLRDEAVNESIAAFNESKDIVNESILSQKKALREVEITTDSLKNTIFEGGKVTSTTVETKVTVKEKEDKKTYYTHAGLVNFVTLEELLSKIERRDFSGDLFQYNSKVDHEIFGIHDLPTKVIVENNYVRKYKLINSVLNPQSVIDTIKEEFTVKSFEGPIENAVQEAAVESALNMGCADMLVKLEDNLYFLCQPNTCNIVGSSVHATLVFYQPNKNILFSLT